MAPNGNAERKDQLTLTPDALANIIDLLTSTLNVSASALALA
jgi:hypothetical protein